MYYIPQVTKSGCGFTCLKMLLAIAHNDEKYLYLKEDEFHQQYSYQELLEIAQRYDVTLIGGKYPDKNELRHVTDFPLILTVDRENRSPHAVLAVKRKGNYIKIHDPSKGVYWQKIDKFLQEWDATFLAIRHVEARPFTLRQVDAKDRKGEVASYILHRSASQRTDPRWPEGPSCIS